MIGLTRKNSPLIGWKEVLGVCYGWTWDVVLVAKFNDFSKSMLLVLDFSVNCPLRSVSQQGLFFLSSFKYTCVCVTWENFSVFVFISCPSHCESLLWVCRKYAGFTGAKDMRWTTFLVWYFEENKDSSFEILSTRFYKAVLKKQSIHLEV